MAARLTAAEAKRLGIDPKLGAKRTVRRTTQRAVKGEPYRTRCCTCDEIFTTRAAEDRHVENTTHRRYALLLT